MSILYHHRFFDADYEELIDSMNDARQELEKVENLKKDELVIVNNKSKYQDQYVAAEHKFSDLEEKVKCKTKYRKADYYNLDERKFMFYKQRLFSKGLLIDNPSSRIGSLPFQAMGISEFGKEFVQFIKKSK